MKVLINQLFTKEEIINRQHEQLNERTMKIKGNQSASFHHCFCILLTTSEAIKVYFFGDDTEKTEGFWAYQGKIVRGNQRRGHAFRGKSA